MEQINDLLKNRVKELEAETIKTRAYLYAHPELSSQEFETAKYLKEKVTEMGLIIEEVPNRTGFTALLDTHKPGKTLGIRTDIDALPIQENTHNLNGERKYKSNNPGVMHACGHDGHMAIVLSVINILTNLKDQLTGKIYFIFEDAEENGEGIEPMVDHLKNKGIEAIYGNHLAAFLESGKISVDAGPVMAGAIHVEFTVHGKSGHGSRPDLSINPVFAAAQILSALTSAWSNRLDVTKTVTLGLTQIHGGTANNVIPDKVTIGGSLRFFDVEEGKKALEVMKNVTTLTAQAHECTVEFDPKFDIVALPVINDKSLSIQAQNGINEIMPNALINDVTWFASESFNQYSKIAPSTFAFIGMKNETYGSGAEHHNNKFDVDDKALINGVLATAKFAVDYLMK